MSRRRAAWPANAGEAGQSLVEFAMIVTVVMLFLLGMLEFGFVFDHHLTLEYATAKAPARGRPWPTAAARWGAAPASRRMRRRSTRRSSPPSSA